MAIVMEVIVMTISTKKKTMTIITMRKKVFRSQVVKR
jgi:hypothetical protein